MRRGDPSFVRAWANTAFACLLICALPANASAQHAVQGVVRDSISGEPLAGVRVQTRSARRTRSAVTDRTGRFVFADLPAATYSFTFTRVGYSARRVTDVRVDVDGIIVDVVLHALGVPLDPVIVSVSRTEETALSAPASVSVVTRNEIEDAVTLTPAEHVRDLPGIDDARKGLLQHTIAFRGANSANSGDVLFLNDYRYAAVPSIGFNVPYLLPATDADIERIEVMRGPAAALYGPGAPRGVLHILTRSPLESRGGHVSITAGDRSILAGSFRYAAAVRENVGVKVSGEYFRGDDWELVDPVEARNRADSLAAGANRATLRIGARDFSVARAGGEMRIDWRPDAVTDVVLTTGVAQAIRIVELAPAVGTVQGQNWRYSFGQLRVRRDRLLANLLYNWSDAGDTYLLRSGNPLVDDSRVLVGQMQHGATVGRWDFLYGADVRWTDPRTGGTIHGVNESDDLVSELGGYVHGSVEVSSRVDLIGAVRLDHHSRLHDLAVSPRVGIVVRPTPNQAVRLMYNRAFTSPDANDLFLDIEAGEIPLPGGFRYTLRAVGVPTNGFTFRRDCEGGLCMRSPFAAGDLPVDATRLWPALVALAKEQGLDLSAVPTPTRAQVGTRLAVLDLAGFFVPIDPAEVSDIAGEGRQITNALELGYKGVLGGGLALSADVWVARVSDIPGALFAGTPNAFFDRASLEQYLAGFLPPAVATSLADTASQLPVGTVSPQETAHPVDVLLLNRRGGAYTLLGTDMSVRAQVGDHWSLGGTYSYVSADTVAGVDEVGTVFLNAPRHKGAIVIAFRDEGAGISASVRGRALTGFPVVSGVYAGRVNGYEVVDARASYRLPWRGARFSLQVQNALDDRHREFVGAPEVGRLIVTRLVFTF